jgi:hypothetical protein
MPGVATKSEPATAIAQASDQCLRMRIPRAVRMASAAFPLWSPVRGTVPTRFRMRNGLSALAGVSRLGSSDGLLSRGPSHPPDRSRKWPAAEVLGSGVTDQVVGVVR